MKNVKFPTMEARDERQYMLTENFEILEKYGVPTGAVQMHNHGFYELLYIEEGEFASFVDNRLYVLHKGDFLLIDRDRLHHYQFVEKKHEKSKRLLLWITREYLQSLSGPGVDLTACFSQKGAPAYHFPGNQAQRLAGFLYWMKESISAENADEEEKRLLEKTWLTLFFVTLNRLCRQSVFQFSMEESRSNPMTKQVFDYIDAHIAEPITVDDLASATSLSKYYFLRSFKAVTGMTVHDFVLKKRLMQACRFISDGRPISEVWQSCGFSDYSAFFRNFKKSYGMSPREFKSRWEG